MPVFVFMALVMVEIDQLVKIWALTELKACRTIPIIENVFHLTYVENRGAAFSLLASFDSRWLFIGIAIVITIAIWIALHRQLMQTRLGRCALVLIAAGAVGNAIDRVIRGFVVDLFDFRLINFPVFNVADIFICAGGALFVFYILFQHKDAEKEASAVKEPDAFQPIDMDSDDKDSETDCHE